MKKIKNFIKNHKVISGVVGFFLAIVLLDSIINNDFENLKSMVYSLVFLCIYLYILYLMTSRKSYLCPKCNKKVKKGNSYCTNCGYEFDSKSGSKPVSKRTFLKSKLFLLIGEAFIYIPLGLGFLYLLFAPIVFATSGESMTAGNTLFVCYTKPHLLPYAIAFTLIGLVFVLIGLLFKKKERE